MSNRIPPGYDNGNISTLFDKLDEKQRKKLDEAIVRRNPSTLTKIHETYHLAEKGISYPALYRYARKLRDEATRSGLLESTFSSDLDIAEHLKNQLGRVCIDLVFNNENPNGLDAHRAALAYHKALQFAKIIKETQLLDAPPRVPTTHNPQASNSKAQYSDPAARWGRHEDSTPITHEEHLQKLNRVLNHVCGISLPGLDQSRERESQDLAKGGRPESNAAPCAITHQSREPEAEPLRASVPSCLNASLPTNEVP